MMHPRTLLLLLFPCMLAGITLDAQSFKLYGKITNTKMEPLAYVSIQVKEFKEGVTSKEDGTYELPLEEGIYELVVSMVGYQARVFTVVISKTSQRKDIILEEADASNLAEVTIKGKFRDRAEEYIKNVIRNKEKIMSASGLYSCMVYIKAFQEDSMAFRKPKKAAGNDSLLDILRTRTRMDRMALAEIVLKMDRGPGNKIREERTGVSKRGNADNLFYLSTAQGDFNFYENLVTIPAISQTSFLSPLSYSGLMAYRYKLIKTETVHGKKQHTISVKPRQLSNATVEGEITVADSTWVLLHTKLRLPKYHLAEYDLFEIEQDYELVNDKAWMITRQTLTYNAISDKMKSSGTTVVSYRDFELNRQFPKNHFGSELSASTEQAYKRDSTFWQANRAAPLTEKEVRFIFYKDSVYDATHSKAYLDSVDRVTNKVTWQNILYKGQSFNNHEKQRRWTFPALPALYYPFQFGGTRIQASFTYAKTYKSRKHILWFNDISYGLRNRDINGSTRFTKLYNPYSRGYYHVTLEKDFEYIFSGDAWINMVKRNNIYLNQAIGFGHSIEIANGLYLFSDAEAAFRSSVKDYRTNDKVDSLFGDYLDDNQAVDFPSYNAFYGELRLEYTPGQRYIREPKEKVILGSAWPTVYVLWRKGIPGILSSKVDFDYLEFGIRQSARLGIMGTSSYSLKTGSFLTQKDLRLVDYKFQRRGDPILFMNPNEAFQSLDSSFPVFKRFYEAHYLHEFNGALLNKIPFFKKIGLREIAGAGFLYAQERNLKYAEVFTGVERVFKYPFNQLGKFKVGVYVIGSAANQFRNPLQFKIGITTWDRKRGKWF